MSGNVLSAEQALNLMATAELAPAIAPIPYTSTIDGVNHPEHANNWQEAVDNHNIVPSVPTLIVCRAAAALAIATTEDTPNVIVAGEHTFGPNHKSTTELMEISIGYEFGNIQQPGSSKKLVFADEKPLNANTTTHQIAWLARQAAEQPEGRKALLVAFAQHIPRLKILAKLYGLEADFVDAHAILQATGQTDPTIDKAVQLFNKHNKRYETIARWVTKIVSLFGPEKTLQFFESRSRKQGPNVVDIEGPDDDLSFVQMPAPQMVQRKAA